MLLLLIVCTVSGIGLAASEADTRSVIVKSAVAQAETKAAVISADAHNYLGILRGPMAPSDIEHHVELSGGIAGQLMGTGPGTSGSWPKGTDLLGRLPLPRPGTVAVSDVQIVDGQAAVVFATSFKEPGGALVYVAEAAPTSNGPLAADLGAGGYGTAFLVDSHGRYVEDVAPHPAPASSSVPLPSRAARGPSPLQRQAARGTPLPSLPGLRVLLPFRDLNSGLLSGHSFFVVRSVSGTPWTLVVQVPRVGLFYPLHNEWVDWAVLGLCYLSGVVAVLLLGRLLAERRAHIDAHGAAVRLMQERADFLARMSHDLRTPTSGVVGMAQLLAATGLDEPQREYVDAILISGQNLLETVNDVLDISRIEAKGVTLRPEPVDIVRLCDGVVVLLLGNAGEKGVRLQFKGDKRVPRKVSVDPVRLRKVLMNLMCNAVKFTKDGEVNMEMRLVPTPERPGVVRLRFEVCDTGVGIDTHEQVGIFEPFRQAANQVEDQHGTGLGLAISKALVEMMGGTIGVESIKGAGSRFWFEIDTYELEPTSGLTEKTAAPKNLGILSGLSVLLAEDNLVNQLHSRVSLEKHGCRVIIAADGVQAVTAATGETHFDLILMDVRMPNLDGYGAARAIREARHANSSALIIALTANALPQDELLCFAARMNGYLVKPLDEELLAEKLTVLGFKPGGVQTLAPALPEITGVVCDRRAPDLKDLIEAQTVEDSLRLDAAIEACDAELVKRAAHAIAGTALVMDMADVVSLARYLEAAARANPDLLNWEALAHELARKLSETRSLLAAGAARLLGDVAKLGEVV